MNDADPNRPPRAGRGRPGTTGVRRGQPATMRRGQPGGIVARLGAAAIDGVLLLLGIAGLLALMIWQNKAIYVQVMMLWAAALRPLIEGACGGTPGKLLCRLRVVDRVGNRAGYAAMLSRHLAGIVGFPLLVVFALPLVTNLALLSRMPPGVQIAVPLIALAAWLAIVASGVAILFSAQRRALHDRWAGTWVVRRAVPAAVPAAEPAGDGAPAP